MPLQTRRLIAARHRSRNRAKGNHDLFSSWTPEEAWLAGVIWSDGCLSETRSYARITIVSVDEELLVNAARIAGVDYRWKPPSRGRQATGRVEFAHHEVIARLRGVGLEPRKSLTARLPDIPHSRHFVRGYFDGDGCAYVARRAWGNWLTSNFVGGLAFLDDLIVLLAAEASIKPRRPFKHGPIHRIAYGQRDSLRLAEYMYGEDGPCLSRKKAIFDAFSFDTMQRPGR